MQPTAAAVTPPAELAARRPAGEADAAAADAGVSLIVMTPEAKMIKVSLLFLAALLLPSECLCADDLLVVMGEGAFLGLTVVSSLTCTGFNVVHLAQRNPSEGWGTAGVMSGAVLALLSFAVANDNEIDDQICWQCTGALAAVTFLVGIGNLTGAQGQQKPSPEKAVSLVAGMRPDGPRSLQPTLGLVWRF